MQKNGTFSSALALLTKAESNLEHASLAAFQAFETQYEQFSVAITDCMKSRQRAARWMMMHRAAFDGKSAYEIAAEGDFDMLWDTLSAITEMSDRERLEAGLACAGNQKAVKG
jgi:hypothetical protein